ncbi:MAG: TFIIB-type zinc ribbon-containing protein [Oscillospiraceae bacterium]|jgi:DNA-directed RNA polymerase subunit RPC12/RpoP|nr:TFIIB-type zinc ribbon-containing protein [Oscillospiraceae bacterium]
MAVLSYKCPNCSGPLTFSAEKQLFACDYCRSEFTQPEMERLQKNLQDAENETQKEPAKAPAEDADFSSRVSAYTCPSCGAEIMTTETTAASTCYYCHNPVVLSGRLSQEFKPDKIIPFRISKEQALAGFKTFCGKKRFLPSDFYSPRQVENIRGVYYPYFLVESKIEAGVQATAEDVRVWRVGETEYTEVKTYSVVREGEAFVDGISVSALQNSDHNMLKYVCPFEESQLQDFEMTYLSGFEAEKRDLGKAELRQQVSDIMNNTVEGMLRDTISGYRSVKIQNLNCRTLADKWEYALFPVWVLTYHYKGEAFVFAMNGQTGKLYGRLPVAINKMLALGASVFAGVSALLTLFLLGGGPA